jgi:isoquinoline 1-oxidoreductase subunit beta
MNATPATPTMPALPRRGFLTLLGGALTLGFNVGCSSMQAKMVRHAEATGELTPNMYIGVKADGRVALALNKTEMGQGVATGYSSLVAEELDVSPDAIEFYFADSLPEYKTSFFMHQTGGSTSTKEAYLPLRRAAASAREMLVAAAAARWQVSPASCTTTDGHVVHVESKRRLGYGELTREAARQHIPDEPRLKPEREFKVIGKRGRRVDARAKVDGSAKYGLDVIVPQMARALVIHGPVYGAEPVTVRAEAARKRPGVIDVFPFRWGVAIVAEKYWQALAAARDVEVTWTSGDAAGLDTDKLREAARSYGRHGASVRSDGDVAGAVAKAATKIEAVYEAPFLAHATMEPQNCTVRVDGTTAEVWAPCQAPTLVQAYVGDALGIAPSDVLVHTTYAGGGFGRRYFADWAAQAALIARHVKRPVQMIWSRESDMTQGFYRPQASVFVRGVMSEDGKKPTALSAHVIGQSIALQGDVAMRGMIPGVPNGIRKVMVDALLGMIGSNTVPDLFAVEGLANTPYAIENLDVEFTPVRTGLPVSSWRSVGNALNAFAVESFVDELARATRQDPLEVRRRMVPPGSRPRRALDAVAALAKWGGARRPGVGRGLARHFCFDSEVAQVADVEILNGRIRVRRVYAVVDCGIAINPDVVRAQVEGAIIFGLSAALDQEITLREGVVQQTNFDTFPVLRLHECPEIIVEILTSDRAPSGAGEPGVPPIAPAVANAVCDLTGVRLRRLPLQRSWEAAQR